MFGLIGTVCTGNILIQKFYFICIKKYNFNFTFEISKRQKDIIFKTQFNFEQTLLHFKSQYAVN